MNVKAMRKLSSSNNTKDEKPSNANRRDVMLDAAIEALALQGPRGFTHREVDRRAGLPLGSCSNLYTRRDTLLTATAERVIELDIQDFEADVGPLYNAKCVAREQIEEAFTNLYYRWSRQDYQIRARARLEITAERVRNETLREATESLISSIQQRFLLLFNLLEEQCDASSAKRFNYILQGLHLIIADKEFPLTKDFLRKIISEYLVIAIGSVKQ